MSPLTKKRLTFLAGFLLYFVLLWALWDTVVIYPIKVFVVLLHEVSHALAAMATGGSVERILLNANQGGAAYTVGGNPFITLSAGTAVRYTPVLPDRKNRSVKPRIAATGRR